MLQIWYDSFSFIVRKFHAIIDIICRDILDLPVVFGRLAGQPIRNNDKNILLIDMDLNIKFGGPIRWFTL